ncbi:N-acetylneuraminate synthase family protein [Hyunsoonleella sp. 2307UL5-6]|uniref:N-acetylneuraminate synthase family protein n=1 Tax=Hyunsoonleella sp. 2307UL5-6 TaxID=3384768 RepID=UPI0039BC64D6
MKVIAESAFNHNGSLDYLKKLARKAKEANTDFFTMQIMDVSAFCVEDYSKYDIYENNTLSFEEWELFFSYCNDISLNLIPCVLDIPSLNLALKHGYKFIKIHATDITNISLLKELANISEITLILETQCATHLEIEFALSFISEKVECLMHGFSNYPTEIEDLNLNALDYFKTYFPSFRTGLADHSLDTESIPLMAMAKGCQYLEKHITISRNNRNFDWQVSLYPHEFSVMVQTIKHYKKALGNFSKHPTKTELGYRDVMYKKVLDDNYKDFKRADAGVEAITHKFNSFDKEKVGVALICRLKSKRLPLKVLKPFHDTFLVDFLYKRLSNSKKINKVVLSTSSLSEDSELVEISKKQGHNTYLGHPVSVVDRMLGLSLQEEFGAIFRVTGDNPFTDVDLMDQMIETLVDNDLDYVRANNVPFGLSAELFSTSYLWKLYLDMDNPMNSEYLTLFVLNDKEAKKGCLDIESSVDKLAYINFSVDYQEDLDRSYVLLNEVTNHKNPYNISLKDIIDNETLFSREDNNKIIKLPEGEEVKFDDFLNRLYNQNYFVRKKIKM